MADDKSITSSDVSVSAGAGYDPEEPATNSTRLSIRTVYTGLKGIETSEAKQAAEQLRAVEDVHEQYERALVLSRRYDIDVPGVLR